MEPIKVNVSVSVELSESTKDFLQTVLYNVVSAHGNSSTVTGSATPTPVAPAAPAVSATPAKPAEPEIPATPATPAEPEIPATPAKPAEPEISATPAPATPAAPTEHATSATPAVASTVPTEPAAPGITIEQVRQALAIKVTNHREEIKNKLTELGAPSVTKLDPSKYSEMLVFLHGLA